MQWGLRWGLAHTGNPVVKPSSCHYCRQRCSLEGWSQEGARGESMSSPRKMGPTALAFFFFFECKPLWESPCPMMEGHFVQTRKGNPCWSRYPTQGPPLPTLRLAVGFRSSVPCYYSPCHHLCEATSALGTSPCGPLLWGGLDDGLGGTGCQHLLSPHRPHVAIILHGRAFFVPWSPLPGPRSRSGSPNLYSFSREPLGHHGQAHPEGSPSISQKSLGLDSLGVGPSPSPCLLPLLQRLIQVHRIF